MPRKPKKKKAEETGHISIRETIRVCVPKFLHDDGYVLEDEEIEYNESHGVYEEVDAEEYDISLIDKIKALRGGVANEMGFDTLGKIYNNPDYRVRTEFNKRLTEAVHKQLNITWMSPEIVVTVNKETLEEYLLENDLIPDEKKGTQVFIKNRLNKNK